MRDLLILAGMLVWVPLSLSNAFSAYLLWGWTSQIALNDYIYGFMRGVPINMIFALITLFMIFLGRDKARARVAITPTSLLFMLFALQATISFLAAYSGLVRNEELYTNLLKALVFCLLMPCILTERYRIHAFVATIVLGLSFHGVIEGLKYLASGGGHKVQGLVKFGDNNQFAVVIMMAIPLLVYLFRYSERRLVRVGVLGGILLSVAAVIATNSRGGFVSLTLMTLWMVFSGRRKILGVLIMALGLVSVVALAPDSWSERMDTIKDASKDSSFMTRVVAWKVSSQIALQNPLTGGGFHAVQAQPVWDRFRLDDGLLGFVDTPYRPEVAFAAHSIYFEILGDLGFVGLGLFLIIIGHTFWLCFRIRRQARRQGAHLQWAADLAAMLGASMFAYVIGAAALSLGYFEVMYIFVMLMQVLALHVSSNDTTRLRAP